MISASDVRLGDRRAELMALARRAYYTLTAPRMKAAPLNGAPKGEAR